MCAFSSWIKIQVEEAVLCIGALVELIVNNNMQCETFHVPSFFGEREIRLALLKSLMPINGARVCVSVSKSIIHTIPLYAIVQEYILI